MTFFKHTLLHALGFLARMLPHEPRLTILLYHSVSRSADFFAVRPEVFAEHVKIIKERADIISIADAVSHARGRPLSRDAVVFTFDDGYKDFADEVVPVLIKENIPAAVFVMGGEPDRKELGNEHPLLSSGDSAALSNRLVTIGSHGATHRKITKLSEPDARAELTGSKEAIRRALDVSPRFFAYPKGAWNTRVAEYAREAGYEAACTVEQRSVRRSDSLWALPRIQIDSSTTQAVFRAKLTPAANWYHALWKLFH